MDALLRLYSIRNYSRQGEFWNLEDRTRSATDLDLINKSHDYDPGKGAINLVQLSLLIGAIGVILIRRYGKSKQCENDLGDGKKGTKKKVPTVKSICPIISIPIIDSAYNLYQMNKYGVKFFERRMKEYGHYYEMPFGLSSAYFVSDPTILQRHMQSTNPNHLNKAKEYREIFLKDFMEDALFSAETDIWFPHRKILSRAFTLKSVHSYLGIMNRNAKRMSQEMVEEVLKSPTGSVEGERLAELQFNTVKIMAEIILGTDVMTDEEHKIFLDTYLSGKEIFLKRTFNPLLLLKPIWWFHPQRKELEDGIKFMRKFINSITSKYKEKSRLEKEQGIEPTVATEDDEVSIGKKPFRCILEEMLIGGMSDHQIVDDVLGMILAGHETTSMAMNTLMFHLALHPEYQKMCRDEVDELLSSKLVESDYDCELTLEDANNLKVLERCILENLRMTPPLPVYVRRLDEPLQIDENFRLDGNGKNVIMLPWCLHRNPEYYPNPDKYDPDRFLPENVKERQAKHQYSYLPFSSGMRMCIGMKMSIVEMKIVMFWILRNFEIYTTDKMEDITFRVDITLQPHKDINLILKRRNLDKEG